MAEDEAHYRSEMLRITVHVLENMCDGNTKCVGPEKDPDCESKDRATGILLTKQL